MNKDLVNTLIKIREIVSETDNQKVILIMYIK